MSFPAHFPVDTQGCISRDLPCIRCGYVLRTLTPGANCPECGTPVIKSLDIERLHFAPRAWRKSLVVTLYVLAALPLAWFLLNVASLGGIVWAVSQTAAAPDWMDFLLGMLNVGLLLAYVVSLCLVMRLRTDVVDGSGRLPVERRGNWAMSCTILGAIGIVGTMAASMVPDTVPQDEDAGYVAMTCFVLLQLGFGLAMSRLASHARTIPRRRLAGNMEWIGWTIAGSVILMNIVLSFFTAPAMNVAIGPQRLTVPGSTLRVPVTTDATHPYQLGWSPPGSLQPGQPPVTPPETNRTVSHQAGTTTTNIAFGDGSRYIHALLPDQSWNGILATSSGDLYQFVAPAPASGQNHVNVGVFQTQPIAVASGPSRQTKQFLAFAVVNLLLSCISLAGVVAAMIALFMLARAVSAIR